MALFKKRRKTSGSMQPSGAPRETLTVPTAKPTINTQGMMADMAQLPEEHNGRYVAPKGMSFRDAFKEARFLEQQEFDWYDAKIGKYRPIAVKLAEDQTSAIDNKSVNTVPSAVNNVTVPSKERTYNGGTLKGPTIKPQKYNDNTYVASRQGNMEYPEQNENYANFQIRQYNQRRQQMGILDESALMPNVQPGKIAMKKPLYKKTKKTEKKSPLYQGRQSIM